MSARNIIYDHRNLYTDGHGLTFLAGDSGQVVSSGGNSTFVSSSDLSRPNKKKRKLILSDNTYTCRIVHRSEPPGTWSMPQNNLFDYGAPAPGIAYGQRSGFPDLPPSWQPEDEFALMSKLSSRIRGHNFNLAVSLAEANQTVNMIGSTARRLGRGIDSLRRKDFRSFFSYIPLSPSRRTKVVNSKDMGNAWLEAQYGWIPLLSDVKSGAEALAYYQMQAKTSFRVSHRRSIPVFSASLPSYACGSGSISRRVKVTLHDTAAFDAQSGLGLTDPLSVVWEVTPYSFVADWFIPIGNWLEACHTFRTVGRVSKVTSTLLKITGQNSVLANAVWNGPPSKLKVIHLDRVVESDTPLTVPLPQFKPFELSSFKHFVSGLALLQQSAGRRWNW